MPSRHTVHHVGWSGQTWPAPAGWDRLDAAVDHRLDADELFATLDGRSITMPNGAWLIEIHSIFDEAGFRWIQLTLKGNPPYSMTFQINSGDDADEAVRALSMWLSTLESAPVM